MMRVLLVGWEKLLLSLFFSECINWITLPVFILVLSGSRPPFLTFYNLLKEVMQDPCRVINDDSLGASRVINDDSLVFYRQLITVLCSFSIVW